MADTEYQRIIFSKVLVMVEEQGNQVPGGDEFSREQETPPQVYMNALRFSVLCEVEGVSWQFIFSL